MRPRRHAEHHLIGRIGWLRAAVLGANDGILSTASLISGVAAASSAHSDVLIAGIAGLVAGAMSMAAGEYVSVSSQSDTENAELARETQELADDIEGERQELAQIYVKRGVDPKLAREVALQLMAKDALGAHARDELGISEITTARPVQAALTSAATFAAGAAMPLLAVIVSPAGMIIPVVTTASLVTLAVLGAVGAWAGGANVWRAAPASSSGAPWPWRSRPASAPWSAHKSSARTGALSAHACTELQYRRPVRKVRAAGFSRAARLASFKAASSCTPPAMALPTSSAACASTPTPCSTSRRPPSSSPLSPCCCSPATAGSPSMTACASSSPSCRAYADAVTLRQLMHHTGGLRSYIELLLLGGPHVRRTHDA